MPEIDRAKKIGPSKKSAATDRAISKNRHAKNPGRQKSVRQKISQLKRPASRKVSGRAKITILEKTARRRKSPLRMQNSRPAKQADCS
ncbi:hypothetical protein [Oricola sp.]|uniref:hypothetical protein n=1 Tax=Oricola sp. TaxID=1979950 RepID=UPI003511F600